MAFDEFGYICPYNENCRCKVADCDFCGWNPIVAERRLEEICEAHGIERTRAERRTIDAVDLVIKIGKRITPMVERGCSPRNIYATVLKCIAAAPTLETEQIPCAQCRFAKYEEKSGEWKCRRKKGLFRTVAPDEYCSRGERRAEEDGKQ